MAEDFRDGTAMVSSAFGTANGGTAIAAPPAEAKGSTAGRATPPVEPHHGRN
ncbi:MAG TPA: hypothetical protein V6D22_06090 [Candidatus Obscuribacterales bacterium]